MLCLIGICASYDGLGNLGSIGGRHAQGLRFCCLSVFFCPDFANEGRQADLFFFAAYHIFNAESPTLLSFIRMYVRLLLPRAGVFLSSVGHCYDEHPTPFCTGSFSRNALVAVVLFPYALIQFAALCRPVLLPQSPQDNLVHKQI